METSNIKINHQFSTKQIITFWISLILFIFLFYEQNIGFNLFLFTFFSQILVWITNRKLFLETNVKLYSISMLITSASAAWFGDFFSIFFSIVLLLFYHTMIFDTERKLVYAPLKALWNNVKNYVFAFSIPIFGYRTQSILKHNKWFYYFVFPTFAVLLFIILYSFINKNFGDIFSNISLEFLDFGFIFFCCFGFILLLPFWFYRSYHTFQNLEYSIYTEENFRGKTIQNFKQNQNYVLQK